MQTRKDPPPQIKAVQINAERLAFDLMDGRSIGVPLAYYPTLLLASDAAPLLERIRQASRAGTLPKGAPESLADAALFCPTGAPPALPMAPSGPGVAPRESADSVR